MKSEFPRAHMCVWGDTRCQGYGEYCIIVGWDAGAAAMRFRGRGQASKVPWLYGTVPYGWAEHSNSVAL